jgi:hypothetical protein
MHQVLRDAPEFGQYDQVGTVQEQFPIKAGQLSLVPNSATRRGRSHTSKEETLSAGSEA